MPTYYKVEKGKVLGYVRGSNIPGDPTSTYSRLMDWKNEDPDNRKFIEKDRPIRTQTDDISPEYLKEVDNEIVVMTPIEIAQQKSAKKSKRDNDKNSLKSAVGKLVSVAGLTADEVRALKRKLED